MVIMMEECSHDFKKKNLLYVFLFLRHQSMLQMYILCT